MLTENGSVNGHANGNGHVNGKNGEGVFTLQRKEDQTLSQVAPAARRQVMFDTSIPEAARMFYCYLIDCSLWTGVASRQGVVRFANSYLAAKFKVTEKTIQNWKNYLRATGRIWTTEKFMKNSYPQTVYNIVALVGQQMLPLDLDSADGSLPDDEVSSNRRRFRNCVRGHDGKFVRGGARPPKVLNAEIAMESTAGQSPNEKILPLSTAIDCRPPRQTDAAPNGNILPCAAETDCRAARKIIAAENGKDLPPTAANGFRSERKPDAGIKESPDECGVVEASLSCSTAEKRRRRGPVRAFVDEDKQRNGSTALKANLDAEKAFLEALGMITGPKEMANWGGRWRNRYREDSDKAMRVLAELKSMHKEGRIVRNAGACADDLWRRFA
jgi:hypothetical protein